MKILTSFYTCRTLLHWTCVPSVTSHYGIKVNIAPECPKFLVAQTNKTEVIPRFPGAMLFY